MRRFGILGRYVLALVLALAVWVCILHIYRLKPRLVLGRALFWLPYSPVLHTTPQTVTAKVNPVTSQSNVTVSQSHLLPSKTRFIASTTSTVSSSVRTTPKQMLKGTTDKTGRVTSLLQRSDKLIVPNVVHYTWFGHGKMMEFHHMVSFLAAYKHIQPEQILLHCDNLPVGEYWDYVQKKVKNLKIIHRPPPSSFYGIPIIFPEHMSDFVRIQTLLDQGGIYLDTDVIALKSFEPLRHYEFTMGIEYHGKPGRLNSGTIVSAPNATFLRLWQESYRNYTSNEWDYHACVIPYNLQYEYPHLIHVEQKSLNYPSGPDRKLIYNTVYDWSQNYAIHLWHRLHQVDNNPEDIKTLNTTFGQIARLAYYGSSDLILPGKNKTT